MGEIINMSDYRPHINIQVPGAIHVYPREYFKDLADGKDVEPLPDDVLRAIIGDWLEWIDTLEFRDK